MADGYNYIGMSGEFGRYDPADKDKNAKVHIARMLSRSLRMFRYKGLPDTIPERSLELLLQCNGSACWTNKYNGKDWFVYRAALGGEPNQVYMPTIAIIANPAQRFDASLKIDEECIIMPNDSMYMGLLPDYERFAAMLVENELTMRCADIWARLPILISAGDNRSKEGAEQLIEDILDGKLSVAAEAQIFAGVKAQTGDNGASAQTLVNLIQYHQYLKAGWYNLIGLNSNYNMKREAINSNETQMDNDTLYPLIDDMLNQRRKALEKVEAMGGPHIEVELNSAWEDRQEERDLEQELLEAEADTTEEGGEDNAEEEENPDRSDT